MFMAKLYFRYGAMNSGKSTSLLQAAYNYEERGHEVLIAKPVVDAKCDSNVLSRLGVNRVVDFIIEPEADMMSNFAAARSRTLQDRGKDVSCLFIDEAQFLSEAQVDDLIRIVLLQNIPVIAYGIRTDFLTMAFPGSRRLLEIAHSIEELKTICRCGRKAMFNARKLGNEFVFDGQQLAIEGINADYESLCGICYLQESDGMLGRPQKSPLANI
jgi:thymidine kinase